MNRSRVALTALAFLTTFAWLLAPEVKATPAVLWPTLLAVGLAFLTRDIHLSLFLGAFSGALLLHRGDPWPAFYDLWIGRLIPSLTDPWNLSVLVFTLMMGGFVEVLNRAGGMAALSRWAMGRSRSPRRAGLGAYFMGWLVFFDGLASSMLVGKTLRPLADRTRLSREKLAFIADSTSAPIAGLSLLSTWVAYEMSVIRQGLANTGDPGLAEAVAPFSWLVASLPFRFYNGLMLLLVFLLIWLGRDWGPMWAAEKAARLRPPSESADEAPPAPSRIVLALLPLSVLVLGVFGGLYVGGGGLAGPLTFSTLVEAMGKADAAAVFVLATAVATMVALALAPLGSVPTAPPRPEDSPASAFLRGMEHMFIPASILVLAWMLNSVIKELGTARYLVALLGERLPVACLPAVVFLLASLISFSTGTSWGTMAIVMPLVVPLAVTMTGFAVGHAPAPVLMATVGAVLAGAVFGDHCSPLSDTTIVSAFSCDCDVLAHVRTQLPYALTAALLATALGYLPAGLGISPWWLWPAGILACWGMVRWRGRPVDG